MAKGVEKVKVEEPVMVIRAVPLDRIEVGAQMVRHDQNDDDIVELAGDIAAKGLLQPVGVSELEGGRYQLHWGSRRLAAYQRLCRRLIPARVIDPVSDSELIAMAMRENLLRRDLTLREEIDAVRRLVTEGRSSNQISDLLSKSRAWVDRRLAFDSLPPVIREHVLAGDLPIGHGEALALMEDPGAQSYLVTHCLQHRPSLVTLRALIEGLAATPTFGEAVEAGAAAAQSAQSAQPFLVRCPFCGDAKRLDELVIIRACPPCLTAVERSLSAVDSGVGNA